MYLADISTTLQPLVTLFTALIISGAGVTLATEILKMNFIPIPAERYPQVTAAIASVIAAVIVAFTSALTLPIAGGLEWAGFALGVYLLAAMIYNHIVRTVTA